MDKKRQLKSVLKGVDDFYLKPKHSFTESERHQIIQEFLNSGCTKREIWKKYTGEPEEHGQILRWMRQLGYYSSVNKKRFNFTSTIDVSMPRNKKCYNKLSEEFQILQLQKRIFELESELKEAQMKAITYSTMVDIAEREFNISIRKKYNTKSSKK